jgi:DNA-binding transcriptional LysR family regulator
MTNVIASVSQKNALNRLRLATERTNHDGCLMNSTTKRARNAERPPEAADDDTDMGRMTSDFLIRHATLRQLQVFEAIVRLGSFTRAAEEMFLTQPTVSLQMKKLAESVGLTLLEPVGRHTRPTDAGLELYQACRTIFRALGNLESKFADIKGLRAGKLRLGVITTAKYFAPEILGEFCKKYPGIDISLKVSNRERVIERILASEDDLYILGTAPPGEIDLVSYPFAPNPLVVIASQRHPLVGQRDIDFAQIAKEPFILREPGSGTRDTIVKYFASQGRQPRVRLELGSNEAIKHAVVGGLGLAIQSLHTLTLEGVSGPIALLDVKGFPLFRQWYIVHPRNRELSVIAKAFLDFALSNEPAVRRLLNDLLTEAGLKPLALTSENTE